jgi:hypothetical protein
VVPVLFAFDELKKVSMGSSTGAAPRPATPRASEEQARGVASRQQKMPTVWGHMAPIQEIHQYRAILCLDVFSKG